MSIALDKYLGAVDYDPNPETRGRDIEIYSTQAIREAEKCNRARLSICDEIENLVISVQGAIGSWSEVDENSKKSPELPQAKKWAATAKLKIEELRVKRQTLEKCLSEIRRMYIG